MRVKARCPYRNFKSHMPAAARSYRKRVVYQDRHLVGKFVVTAVHDFVDSCKHRFLTRVKLQTMFLSPLGLEGLFFSATAVQQRRLLLWRSALDLLRLIPQRKFHAVVDTNLIVDGTDVIPNHVRGNTQFRSNLTILEALRNEFDDSMLSSTESPLAVEQ